MPTPERREREDERAFLHRVRKLLHRLLLREDFEQPLTEDLLAETEARVEELELKTPGLKPLPELREREWEA